MSQYAMPHDQETRATDVATRDARLAIPNMQAFAFTTIIWGAVFAGFLIRPFVVGIGLLAVVAFFGGLALFLGGMNESARENPEMGTFFESYGVFLISLGALVAPTFGIAAYLGGNLNVAVGFLFLTWTVFNALYIVTAVRTNPVWLSVLGLLFLASLGVTLGSLISVPVLSLIGGWIAIVSGLVAWYGMLSRLLETGPAKIELPRGGFQHAP
ncbi:acetate uptake transporter family protein [Dictyobacter formicarum]|uniref:DUF308 domain-containing protein n=1 Tax=Dictyobacter formicarum TaxID=2778368 RepID=A0ABQ3VFR4_9CHLR|nr:GPR1/FUN34/YaaH family transporter [Dictyobacter formicarum]GHO84757.1 hypothetical protein KSZ_27630 [Dictyobacter formicarum]